VTLTNRFALLLLLFVPALAAAQSIPGLEAAKSMTVNRAFDPGHYVPMTPHERLMRWWKEDGGSPTIHVEAFLFASSLQVENNPSEWGRNIGGYGRRVGDVYGRTAIENTVHEGMGAIARTDTRYFACSCRGFFPRLGHALDMTIFTYTHSGHKILDVSQLSGAYGGAMISTMWWPPHYSPLVQGVQDGHTQVGLIGAVHVIQEFSPELKRAFHIKPKTMPDRHP
jgi:hypothetical protein